MRRFLHFLSRGLSPVGRSLPRSLGFGGAGRQPPRPARLEIVPAAVPDSRRRRARLSWGLLFTLLTAFAVAIPTTQGKERAPSARILKVLPHYLDKQGRHSINPSLMDRDAYQFELRRDPSLRSGMRFDILWKTPPRTPAALTVKLELRGSRAPQQAPVVFTSRAFSRGGFSQWTLVTLPKEDYEALGELSAWRVTLWKDEEILAEQTSFLW